jgi:Ca2+-binding RTX toxin-like protein
MTTFGTRTASAITLMGLLALGLGGAASASTVSTQDKVAECQGVTATKVSGARHIWGTRGDDVIVVTGSGRHVVHARGGNDLVCGSDGVDIIYGGAGADRLLGKGGKDRLHGGTGDDDLSGGDGDDREFGEKT